MNAIQKIAALSLCFLLGCASSQPKSSQTKNVTGFKTEHQPMDVEISSNSLTGDMAQFYYRARARCKGEGCVPKSAKLIFSVYTGSNEIYLANQDFSIRVDDEHFNWQSEQWINIKSSSAVDGDIITVTLDIKTLKTIATADIVTGSLASYPFTWSYEDRKPLRVLLKKIKNPSLKKSMKL